MGGKRWTSTEDRYLTSCLNDGKTDKFDIAKDFHVRTNMAVEGFNKRSPDAIERRIYDLTHKNDSEVQLATNKPARHCQLWSEEDDILLQNMEGMPWEVIASELERTEEAVKSRVQYLNKRESESILSKVFGKLSNIGNAMGKAIFGSGNKEEGK
jgi:hypothetical protein